LAKPGSTAGRRRDAFRALPPERPLASPRQPVNAQASRLRTGASGWRESIELAFSRIAVVATTAALSAYGIREVRLVMLDDTLSWLQWTFLVLFAASFMWVAFAASQALLGFPRAVFPSNAQRRDARDAAPSRTAVLVPVYNEEPTRVAGALKSMAERLAESAPGVFDIFILSDTRRANAIIEEQAVFRDLATSAPEACPVWYRRRLENVERKAGNVGDWVERWGGGYEAMLVLDADSVMGAEAVTDLARRLAHDPGLGLIQTIPRIVFARSLFARLQQFANRVYGPVYAAGLALWHGRSGNFWGHNAIIRTAAFADAAKLPLLAGRPPFGGHVLSHDFVEAALLRRAGWGVMLADDIESSYEEAPPSLSDVLIRDRRWCQGNLQHARFLFARGLTFASRIHLLTGILSYLSALLWLGVISSGAALAVQAAITAPDYFAEPSLFPTWPVFDSVRAVRLFVITMGIVLLPKALGWASVMLRPKRWAGFAGPVALSGGVVLETVLSALYAPITMLAQAGIITSVLAGRDAGWRPQRRADAGLAFHDALRAHLSHVLAGAGLIALASATSEGLVYWTAPVTAGLVLAPVLSWISGSDAAGQVLRRAALLRTPEEGAHPPSALVEARDQIERWALNERPRSLAALCGRADLFDWFAQHAREDDAPDAFDPDAVLASEKISRSSEADSLSAWLTDRETWAVLNQTDLLSQLRERFALDQGRPT